MAEDDPTPEAKPTKFVTITDAEKKALAKIPNDAPLTLSKAAVLDLFNAISNASMASLDAASMSASLQARRTKPDNWKGKLDILVDHVVTAQNLNASFLKKVIKENGKDRSDG
jgi:hypothetical protein